MSLISAILSGARPTLPGVPTIYRPEDYRDKPAVKEPEVVELTEEVKHAISPTSYEHMIGQKLANISAITACLRNGIDTQNAIRAATGLSQGTICLRLSDMVTCGEVRVNRDRKPWAYVLVEDKS